MVKDLVKIIHVVAAVIFVKGAFFVAKRKAGSSHGEKWEFSGGKVEEGESEDASLKRELLEELGISVLVKERLFMNRFDYPQSSVKLVFYDVEVLSGAPKPLVHEQLAWVEAKRLHEVDFIDADKAVLDQIMAIYKVCGKT